MFVQIIEGPVSDADELRAAVDRWNEELAPGATGWLGSTSGVTDEGRAIAVVRFNSEEEARRNSDRPEQDQWWAQTSKLFTGEPTFRESTQVDVDLAGNPDEAGFVQMIKGRSSDPSVVRELMQQNPDVWRAFRPDILGSVGIGLEDGAYIAVMYFISEEEAREGEIKEAPPELKAEMDEDGERSRSASLPSSTSGHPGCAHLADLALPDRSDVPAVAASEDPADDGDHRTWHLSGHGFPLLGRRPVEHPREEPAAPRRTDLSEGPAHRLHLRGAPLGQVEVLDLGLLVVEMCDRHLLQLPDGG